MSHFRVVFAVDVEAQTALEAAELARRGIGNDRRSFDSRAAIFDHAHSRATIAIGAIELLQNAAAGEIGFDDQGAYLIRICR